MRWKLLVSPGLLCERLAYRARQRRRLRQLRGTVAQGLAVGHIDSLELLAAARPLGIGTIYDIGANVGTWTLLAKAVIPEATVHAFEPLAKHCAAFGEKVRGLEGAHLHAVALGAENAPAVLRVTDFSDASSLLPLAAPSRSDFGVEEVERVDVEVRSLDEYRAANDLAFPDLIKLDVQGYELEVLKGATECLQRAKALIVEASFVEYYERQCLFHELVAFLAAAGLFVEAFGEHTPIGLALRQTDVLFLRRERRACDHA